MADPPRSDLFPSSRLDSDAGALFVLQSKGNFDETDPPESFLHKLINFPAGEFQASGGTPGFISRRLSWDPRY